MDEAQLLTGTEIEQVCEDAGPLGARTVLKVLANLGKEEVLIICGIAPVWLEMRWSWRCSRCRRRWRRTSELLIKVGSGRGHARSRRPA